MNRKKYHPIIRKFKRTFGPTYDTMSKRFLRNRLPVDRLQIHRQKFLTTLKKFDIINHTFPIPVFLPPAADGPCADNRGQKAGPKWLEQYVATKQTNLSVFNSNADRDLMVTLRFLFPFNKETGSGQNASTALPNPVLQIHRI